MPVRVRPEPVAHSHYGVKQSVRVEASNSPGRIVAHGFSGWDYAAAIIENCVIKVDEDSAGISHDVPTSLSSIT
jgi:hypothetical protein